MELLNPLKQLFECETLEAQIEFYQKNIHSKLWNSKALAPLQWDITLSLLGVPRLQKELVRGLQNQNMFVFVKKCIETIVYTQPLKDNYFWWLYLTGSYTRTRAPRYLKKENYELLKKSVDRIKIHTGKISTVLSDLKNLKFNKFILLDHMDWLSDPRSLKELTLEWNAILSRSLPGSRVIWRSGALENNFISALTVQPEGAPKENKLHQYLHFHPEQSKLLQPLDRVQTYQSFYIADIHV